MTAYLGHLAALATSLCWSGTSLFFTSAGKRVGSPVVNRMRLLLALIFVALIHTATLGEPLPLEAEGFRWGWLALSGVIGFALGDAMLFQSWLMIGPRLGSLLLSLHPVFGALLALALLGERLAAREWLGIALAVGGVALVVTERRPTDPQPDAEDIGGRGRVIGVLLGIGAALGQAVGLTFSKKGLAGDFPPLSANAIRLLAAVVVVWAITLARGQAGPGFQKVRQQPRALIGIVGGTLIGPVLGVTLSLFAVQRAPVGVASTLMSLPPIILLPVDRLYYGARIGARAVMGSALAFAGTALLFLPT